MTSDFIPYEQALVLKELGFDEPCIAFFNTKSDESLCFVDLFGFYVEKTLEDFHINSDESKTSAPTFSQAFKFFREKYKFNAFIRGKVFDGYTYAIDGLGILAYKFEVGGVSKTSYEQVELDCLIKLIEIVKNK